MIEKYCGSGSKQKKYFNQHAIVSSFVPKSNLEFMKFTSYKPISKQQQNINQMK